MICVNIILGSARIYQHEDRGSGMIEYILTEGEILLHNLTYNKEVGFHVNVDGMWKNFYTSYSHSLMTGGGRVVEVWRTNGFGVLLKKILSRSQFLPGLYFSLQLFITTSIGTNGIGTITMDRIIFYKRYL